jgi:hypothetical protein
LALLPCSLIGMALALGRPAVGTQACSSKNCGGSGSTVLCDGESKWKLVDSGM